MTPDAILSVMADDKLTARAIADRLGVSRKAIQATLYEMKDAGSLRIVGADGRRTLLWRKAK